MGGEGGTASDHLPLTSDHQWVRRSVKYHSESNTVWLIEKGMYLIIHNKLWIFVEDRILSFSQWHEWFQHPLRVCFCWSAILQSVSFTYNCTNVDCIPVMKEVLVRRKKCYIRYPSAQEYLWNITIFTLLILKQHTRVSVHYESILFMAVNIAPSTSVWWSI